MEQASPLLSSPPCPSVPSRSRDLASFLTCAPGGDSKPSESPSVRRGKEVSSSLFPLAMPLRSAARYTWPCRLPLRPQIWIKVSRCCGRVAAKPRPQSPESPRALTTGAGDTTPPGGQRRRPEEEAAPAARRGGFTGALSYGIGRHREKEYDSLKPESLFVESISHTAATL